MKEFALGSRLHVHLTTGEEGLKVRGYKPTVIHLLDDSGDIRQTDLMITRHFVVKPGYNFEQIRNDILEDVKRMEATGVEVTRTKLEYEGLLDDPLYYECHALAFIPDHFPVDKFKSLAKQVSLRVSNNPKTVVEGGRYYFVNYRMYQGLIRICGSKGFRVSVTDRLKELGDLCDGIVEIEEPRMESAVYDTNIQHDNWWA